MRRHHEHHLSGRTGWLRAAVLGANDGILSTAGLLVGVAAAAPIASNCGLPASRGWSPVQCRWQRASTCR